jgi:hypothetical protein
MGLESLFVGFAEITFSFRKLDQNSGDCKTLFTSASVKTNRKGCLNLGHFCRWYEYRVQFCRFLTRKQRCEYPGALIVANVWQFAPDLLFLVVIDALVHYLHVLTVVRLWRIGNEWYFQ